MAPSRAIAIARLTASSSSPASFLARRCVSTRILAPHVLPQPQSRRPVLSSGSGGAGAPASPAGAPAAAGLRTFSISAKRREGVEPPDFLDEGELHVFNKVKEALEPVRLEVQDISGGCGSMYGIDVESPKFKGLTVIKQHKLVNEILKDEIKNWHGVQLKTRAPK